MIKKFNLLWKRLTSHLRSIFLPKIINHLLHMLTRTCRIEVEGIEKFCQAAANEKCILMLWHNRLALIPVILSRYAPQFPYAALVSGSRDGEILSRIIHLYKNGNTIRVPHQSRFKALTEIVRYIKEHNYILIITPDGPRGPRYQLKPGIAVAALETQAHVFSLNWEAKRYWELKTWDRLRIPKPFTTIKVVFHSPIQFDHHHQGSLDQAKSILTSCLPKD